MALAKSKLEMLRVLEVSATLPRSAAEAKEKLTTLRHDLRVANYIFCRTVAHVRDHELWREGHRTKEAWWRSLFPDVSVRTMYRALSFADNVPLDVALAFDVTKVDLGIRLLRRREGKDVLVSLEKLHALTVSVESGSGSKTIPFKEATTEELAQEALEEHRRALPPVAPTHQRRSRSIRRKLDGIAEVRDQHLGQDVCTVITIRADKLAEFEAALK